MTTQSIRVLIVDDEDGFRVPLAKHLQEDYKYNVDSAASVAVALQFLEKSAYDVVLIDQVLDEDTKSSQRLLKTIKANHPDTQVIMITGWGMENGIEVLRQGAYRYFAKPFNLEELALTIQFAAEESRTRRERQYLRSLFNASSEIISPRDPQEVLQNIVYQAQQSTDAWRAAILLADESGNPQTLASSNFDYELDIAHTIRPSGISHEVLRSGEPRFINDIQEEAQIVNPGMLKEGVNAAACLPLHLRGRNIGVLWVHFQEIHNFSEAEKQALLIFANQSANAYDNARHIRELEQLREATESMAVAAEPKQVLQKIVDGARRVLGADAALIWSYDAVRDIFIPEELVAAGISEKRLEAFRREEPKAGGTTRYVLEKRYVKATDVTQSSEIGRTTKTLIKNLGVKSFQGIRLDVAGEPLGILYLDYQTEHEFGAEDRRILENFANQAALTLKKARLLKQVSRAREVARVVAEATTLGKLEDTLREIVRGANDVLGCDIVTLYTFDEKAMKFMHVAGVGYRERSSLRPPQELSRTSSLWRVVEMNEPYYHYAEDATEDKLLQGGFVRKEDVRSALGIQLRFSAERVGVMFVSYRTLHRFTQDEITDALQFGNQAAVAIRNAQLHGETERRAEALVGLYESGQVITSTLALAEVLTRIAEQALNIVGAETKEGCFSYVALLEGTKIKFIAASPIEMLSKFNDIEIDLGTKSRVGIAGRAIVTGMSQTVSDVRKDADYIAFDANTVSHLSAPLKIADRTIGVLSIEHSQYSAFSMEDVRNIELLASQAAVAIQNAQSFEELRRTKELVGARTALAWMGLVSSTWQHAIAQRAFTISNEIEILRRELANKPKSKTIDKRVDEIELLVKEIQKIPIAAPLSSEQGVQSVPINALVRERAKQLWTNEQYKDITLKFDLQVEDTATVRGSPEWLRRALDIIVDNAVKAVAEIRKATVTIGSEETSTNIRVLVSDNGRGIPTDLMAQLFIAPVQKSAGSKGAGIGLLLATTIVEAYGGTILVESTGAKGTTIAIILPKEQSEDQKIGLSQPRSIGFAPTYDEIRTAYGDLKAARPSEFVRVYNELNRAYEELKELDRKKNEFLSTVSHELRSPLTSIQSCIENLLSGMYGFLTEKQRSRLDVALAGVRDESRLIANLLDLSRIQEGKKSLDLAPADLCKIIHDVVTVFQYDAAQKGIMLAEDFSTDDLPEIAVDAGKIKGVITNLVSNALKFTPTGGAIKINVHKLDTDVEVKVSDTGIGIPEEEFSKIFERFYQVDSSLTRKVGGTGIGLNISKEYVEMHEGRIWVESKVGEGSIFTFTIPT